MVWSIKRKEMSYVKKIKHKDFSNSIIGKYKIIELVEPSKYKVECLVCGWKGVTSIKAIKKSSIKGIKCTHPGGNTIKPGDVYGKYTIIKKLPSKLCNDGLLVPYYECKCSLCGKVTAVSKGTLYATRNRKINDICRHQVVR